MITTEDGGATLGAVAWRRCVHLVQRIVGRDWRRVFTLALGLLVSGVAMAALFDGEVGEQVGIGFIGGSVVGLVFAIAQHTLDLQSVERQIADDLRLTVSSTSDLEGIDLAGADLSSVYLWRKQLRYAHMDRTRLVGADLRASDLSRASLRQADLRGTDLRGSSLEGAVLDGADLSGAQIPGDRLTDARLVGAVLTGAFVVVPDRAGGAGPGVAAVPAPGPAAVPGAGAGAGGGAGADAVEAGSGEQGEGDAPQPSLGVIGWADPSAALGVLPGAGVGVAGWASARVDLSGACLDDARLVRAELPAVRASFVSARRADATAAVLRGGDLSCADLRGCSLSGADLRGADLTGADLRGAVVSRADLRGARLVGARLEHADLTGAIVDGADLRAADLRGSYLTNVDLAEARLDGARARADDLARAETAPAPSTTSLRVDPAAPSGTTVTRVSPVTPVAPVGGRLALVAGGELGGLAVGVAAHLRTRRAGLERVNGDLEGIHLREGNPYAGEAADHGLPTVVSVRSRPPRRRGRAWAELHATDDRHIELVLHPPRGAPTLIAREPVPPGGDAELAGRLATAVQAALADPEVFVDGEELAAFAGWLERPDTPIRPALDEVLRRNPRNPLALVLRAFCRESSDTHDMAEASDEVRIAWAASRSGLVRALAATRLAWAQAQLLHRASDSAPVLARSRSAADAALRLFDGLDRLGGLEGLEGLDGVDGFDGLDGVSRGRRRRPSQRMLILRMKAENAWAFAQHVTELPDDLQAGIARYRRCVRLLERRSLAVSPRTRNSLAYCLMAAAGRFTPGPGAGYAEAIHHLRRLLAHYHLREEHDLDADPGTTVSVRTLARRAAAGQGPPMDLLLRERSLRVGLANLGNLHRLEKRFDAALDCYGAAIYCDPGYVEAYAERAWVHLERADRAAADADIRCALERDVGTPQQKARILIGYADALERVGLEIEQGPWLDEARGRDPGNPRVEDLSRRWKERFGDPT